MKNVLLIAVAVVVVGGAGLWYVVSSSFESSSKGNMINSALSDNNGASDDEEQTGPIAVVNGKEISRNEFTQLRTQIIVQQQVDPSTLDAQMQAQLEQNVVDSLISQELLRQHVVQQGGSVSEADVDAEIATIQEQFPDDAGFEQALVGQGITLETLRARIQQDLATQAYLDEEIGLSSLTATDAEITVAYDEVAAGGDVPPLAEVRDQVEQMVIQKKQQEKLAAYVAELRKDAEVEVLL